MIEITLDGKKVEVREGSMVMDAANKTGTYIPHFCYHKKLTIAANCRMCLVDVEKAPKPLPACATPVTAGMVVHTKSDKAIAAQKGVMEFLLINHPLDCPICDQGGECLLQDLAVGYGGSASRYKEDKRVVHHKDVGPLISMEEMTRCIHCTRCVRFGQEIAGVMELGMLNRSEHAEITTFVGQTVDSELSGNMIDICPVGALTSKPFRYSARTWELSRRKSVSPHDGLGSNLIVQVKNGQVMRVVPLENEAINECWISDKDRFSYEGVNAPSRLTRPMIKQGGAWLEVDWQSALEFVAAGLKDIVEHDGPEAIGALATPHSTLEELYLLQKLTRGLGCENIDARLRQGEDALDGSPTAAPWLGMTVEAFGALDRVLVVGSFLRKDHPLLAQRLRQATKRGAKLSIVHATDDDLLMPVASKVICAPSRWSDALAEIAVAIATEKNIELPAKAEVGATAKAIALQLIGGTRKAIFLGNGAVEHPDAANLRAWALWIANETGATVGVLTAAANTVGAYIANALPGPAGLSAIGQFATPRKAYILLNAEPELDAANPAEARRALDQASLVVALSAFRHTASEYADVMLPIAPFTETAGTFVNAEGRAQSFNGTVKTLGDARPGWKVLRVLGNLCGVEGFEFESAEAVRDELTKGATDLSPRCKVESSAAPVRRVAQTGGLERVADVPIYFADAIVRRAEALQRTLDAGAPALRVNAKTAAALGIVAGQSVRVSQGADSALLECLIDETSADDVARVATAHPLTATLGAAFGTLKVEAVTGAR